MNYELAEKIKAAVLAEPKNVNMNFFCKLKEYDDDPTKKLHLCGTVGCIAGHALFQSGIKKNLIPTVNQELIAQGLLDLRTGESELLFYFHDYKENSPYNPLSVELSKHREGTRAYARVVAKAIDLCVERHRTGVNY